jgi:hypothetical protein
MARAMNLSAKLAAVLDQMQASGRLAEFNREYRRRRMAAMMRGEGYMSFATATKRSRDHRSARPQASGKPSCNLPHGL